MQFKHLDKDILCLDNNIKQWHLEMHSVHISIADSHKCNLELFFRWLGQN